MLETQPRLVAVVVLLVLTALAVLAWHLSQALQDSALFVTLGYAGVFLLTLSCSATLFLPAPAFGAIGVTGGVRDPLLVGLVAGTGAATGELTGYLAGRSGRAMLGGIDDSRLARVRGWVERRGFSALLLLSAIPNPMFDAAGMTAGSLGYLPVRYWVAVALGKTIIYSVIASAGGALAPWFR